MWITHHFGICPDAEEEVVERFARVWLWHILGAFLFPNVSGNAISRAILRILIQVWENIVAYNWVVLY